MSWIKYLGAGQISLIGHLFIFGIFLAAINIRPKLMVEQINVPLEMAVPTEIQKLNPVRADSSVVLKSVNEKKNIKKIDQTKEVFGTNRNSLTATESGAEIEAKVGNTLAKEVDQEQLKASDSDSLPAPTDDYLVSQMPVVIAEVRPEYPPSARAQALEGVVVLNVLVDQAGNVRQALVLEGPEIFRELAQQAMMKFKFKPALVDSSPVAVRIRYSLRFKLNY